MNPPDGTSIGTERPSGPSWVLVGLRCSGKTTVADLLGQQLNLPVIDLDALTLVALGQPSVSEAWRLLGEAAWRRTEASLVEQVLAGANGILALGGGAAMNETVRRSLQRHRESSHCRIIYLRAQPETLVRRMKSERGDRPALTSLPPDEETAAIFAQRDHIYFELADFIIEVDDLSADEVARMIAGKVDE